MFPAEVLPPPLMGVAGYKSERRHLSARPLSYISVPNDRCNHRPYRTTTHSTTELNCRQAAVRERVAPASSFSLLSLLQGHQR